MTEITQILDQVALTVDGTLRRALEFRELALGGAIAVGVILLLQTVLVLWTVRRLRELAHVRERMSRFADGLALLTDTTESGFSALIREVEQIGRRTAPVARASRAGQAKRIVTAARKGAPLAAIAESESLSESEVRLHLSIADARRRKTEAADAASLLQA